MSHDTDTDQQLKIYETRFTLFPSINFCSDVYLSSHQGFQTGYCLIQLLKRKVAYEPIDYL